MSGDDLPPPYSARDPAESAPSPAPAPSFDEAVASASTAPAPQPSSVLSLDNLENGTAFVSASGAEYFALRPPKVSSGISVVVHTLSVPPVATPENFKHPGKAFREHDINEYDWMTFLNHCFLEDVLSELKDQGPVVREKGKIVSPRGSRDSASSSRPQRRGPKNADADAERRVKLIAVIDEWNEGFFGPRGVRIRPEITRTADVVKSSDMNLDAKPAGGETALYKAIRGGDVETTRLLLSKGADPNKYSAGHQPALYDACEKACDNPGWLWTSKGSQPHREILYLLLAYGADVNAKPPAAGGAVHVAAKRKENKLVSLLIKWGANVDKKPSGGGSAFFKAATEGDLEMARILLAAGANVDDAPAGDRSALERTVKNGERQMFDLLIDHGASVEAKWPSRGTPVLAAVERGDIAMLRILLSRGADPDKSGPGQDTALYQAISKGNLDMARTLLEWGADPVKQRMGRETPLAVAVERGQLEFVREMLKDRSEGADPEQQRVLETQARQIAEEKGVPTKDLLG